MPLIKVVTPDMFEYESVVDYLVNPVNIGGEAGFGVAGAGLALEFKKRAPEYIAPYKAACLSKELRIGTIQVLEEIGQPWGMMNLPTKRFYADPSNPDDIKRTLIALRETLLQEKYHHASVVLPMLGCGLGKQDYSVVEPMMEEQLSDLEACVMLSMAPQRTNHRPRYLLLAGPPTFGEVESEQELIRNAITKALTSWGMTLSDYEGILTGGLEGCDTYLGGAVYNKHVEDTYVFQQTGKPAMVIKPNRHRNGVGAYLYQNNLLAALSDDVILFKPERHINTRMSAIQTWLNHDKPKREQEGKAPRRVGIMGEKEITLPHENLIVSVTAQGQDGNADDVALPIRDIDDLPY